MKGMVALALILVGVGIVYVLVRRPTVPTTVTGAGTSNAVFGVFGSIASKISSSLSATPNNKVSPPSLVDVGGDSGTYQQGNTSVDGNTLVSNTTGDTLTYGTD